MGKIKQMEVDIQIECQKIENSMAEVSRILEQVGEHVVYVKRSPQGLIIGLPHGRQILVEYTC